MLMRCMTKKVKLKPFIVYGKDVELKQDGNFGLANVAATVADLLDIEPNPVWEESLIKK